MISATKYNPLEVEDKWYRYWMEKGFFKSVPDGREPYTIVIPPPNVTGVLHMGHMLNNTIQDVLVRKARMSGKNACWVPGTDHASIATEAKVVAMLKERGISKASLSREDFLKYAWEWKEKYGGIILEQLKKLGCSCDWDRTRFTMEKPLSDSVISVFVDLYNKGFIYRGVRMVNWDPAGKTAVSDEEVIHREVNSNLYHIKYKIEGSEDYITIATTRPETILGDTAVCVHPEDERYTSLKGKKVMVPLVGRWVPLIMDEYVDREFGTGALKVTPAHDINDYSLGLKHKLESIDIFDEDGRVNEKGGVYSGKDRFEVRKRIVADLEEAGLLERTEQIKNKVGYSERTDAVIEPRLSQQWFMDMKKFMEKNPEVLDSVMNDEIKFHPSKLKNTYRHWMENIKDWCISRQLWWGQQIPAFYLPNGEFVVGATTDSALEIARAKFPELNLNASDLKQDEDVLDTWFSSWLWPISVFNGITEPGNEDIKYYYPTNDLVTAPEIMFFWVARMIMAGYEYIGGKPFRNVYYTGIVRDKQRRKMSKSLGNSPDPLELIEKYGADGVRMGMLLCSPAGNDILFDESQVEQGRNFCNKLWNAYRLIKGWQVVEDKEVESIVLKSNEVAAKWFDAKLQAALADIHEKLDSYRLSDGLMGIYKLVWDDFCSWYLEMIKPAYQAPINRSTYDQACNFFGELLKVLHPFMPFITEELYHDLHDGKPEKAIIVEDYPRGVPSAEAFPENPFGLIAQIRNIRNSKGLSPKQTLDIAIRPFDGESRQGYETFEYIIRKLANTGELEFADAGQDASIKFMVDKDEVFVFLEEEVDVEAEKEKISKEIEYLNGFMKSVNAKLLNERFMANAKPDVIEKEQQKKADAEAKVKLLEETLVKLG